jgi:hypothetical protein
MKKRIVIASALLSVLAGAAWAVEGGALALSDKSTPAKTNAADKSATDKADAAKADAANTDAAKADGSVKPGAAKRAAARANAGGGQGGNKGKNNQQPLTPEREAAAVTFVTLHHPDLAELLKHLKQSNPREYQRALRELFRQSENLAMTHEKDPRRYELDLEAWKLRSRIQLLAARLSMNYSKGLEDELRAALGEQVDLRLRQQELTRERLTNKLQEVDTEIARINSDREGRVKTELNRIMNEVRGTANNTAGAK